MINYKDASVESLSIHFVGNKIKEGKVVLTTDNVVVPDTDIESMLLKHFCSNFKEPAFYSFKAENEHYKFHDVHRWATEIFSDASKLHELSKKIAEKLFDSTQNAKIQDGDLMVALINDLVIDDEISSALAIFKSENKDDYIKLLRQSSNYRISKNQGLNISKVDKACLIFNTEASEGYKLLVTDKKRLNGEAYYWVEKFLGVTPRADDYYNTAVYIQATKTFIDEHLQTDEGFDKSKEAEILGASKQYFEDNENFNEEEYLQTVFHDDEVIDAFDGFKKNKQLNLLDHFDISETAVKKNSNVFKSVIKLDKNFHIYVHGDRNQIMRGQDADGRKFYKIYYNEES